MDKENKFIERLDNESSREFETYKKIFSNNNEDKELLYNFLFDDLITHENINKNENININTILKNPQIIIEDKINNIYNKISQTNNELLEEVKKKFVKTNNEIKIKIEECNNHIEILKKTYIDSLIKNYIPVNNETKLIFLNKKVLTLQKLKKDNYSLAERFIRIIFNKVTKEQKQEFLMNNNINISNNLHNYEIKNFNDFYDDEKINIFNKNNSEILKFSEMNNNFKYWIVLIYLISQIFNNNSNYEILFNEKECKTNIEKLFKYVEEKKKDKNKKDKNKKDDKHKKKGGSKQNFHKKNKNKENDQSKDKFKKDKNKNKNKNKNKDINIKNLYNDVFENCYIKNNINLKNIYVIPFEKNIKNYFISFLVKKNNIIQNKIKNIPKNNNSIENSESNNNSENISENNKNQHETIEQSAGGLFIDPFEDKRIELKTIVEIKNTNTDKNKSQEILIKDKKLKYDIFQSLKLYKNEYNLKQMYLFISKIKNKIILLLYSLYKLKRNLYEKYLDKINMLFYNNEKKKDEKINENMKNKQTKKESNIQKNTNKQNNNYNKNIKNNNINININNKIKKIQNQILLIENKKGTKNYDEELLEKEEKIKNLLVERYKSRFTHNNI
jgi:hypothetical protein